MPLYTRVEFGEGLSSNLITDDYTLFSLRSAYLLRAGPIELLLLFAWLSKSHGTRIRSGGVRLGTPIPARIYKCVYAALALNFTDGIYLWIYYRNVGVSSS